MGSAPMTGLIIQPIGSLIARGQNWAENLIFSRTFWHLALFLMPNSPVLWVAAGSALDYGRL
jgi:hypothetical protein